MATDETQAEQVLAAFVQDAAWHSVAGIQPEEVDAIDIGREAIKWLREAVSWEDGGISDGQYDDLMKRVRALLARATGEGQ